jgi:hypothetical protein
VLLVVFHCLSALVASRQRACKHLLLLESALSAGESMFHCVVAPPYQVVLVSQ